MPIHTTETETCFRALLRGEAGLDGERPVGPVPVFPEFPPPEPPQRDESGHRPIGPVDEWEEPGELREPTEQELTAFATDWIEEVEGEGRFDLRVVGAYAEPGYTNPRRSILLANWNAVCRETQRWLEAAGCELEWCDEWAECAACCRLVRTQSDSYSWKRGYAILAGDICCADCVGKIPHVYLADLRGDAAKALTLDTVDLAEHGYVRVEREFESGLHPGQDDSPQAIAKLLVHRGIEDFIFSLDRVGQFEARFGLWVRPADAPHATFRPGEGKAEVSPAAALEAALRDAPRMPPGPGVTYTSVTITDEGAVVSHSTLTKEEFVAGILAPAHTDTKE